MLLSIILYAGKDLSLPLRLLSFSAGISARQEVEHFSAGDTTNLELNPSANERFHLECESSWAIFQHCVMSALKPNFSCCSSTKSLSLLWLTVGLAAAQLPGLADGAFRLLC